MNINKRRDSRDTMRSLVAVALDHGGFFTAMQAKSVGYSYRQQHYHKNCGNWIQVIRGIYRLRDYPVSDHADYAVWSLWSGNRKGEVQATISYDTALSFYDLSDINPARIHLTVPPGFRKKSPAGGLVSHRARLAETDVVQHTGFRVTTPLRTLVDVAQSPIAIQFLEGAIDDALRKGLVRRSQLTSPTLPKQVISIFQKTLLELMDDREVANAHAARV